MKTNDARNLGIPRIFLAFCVAGVLVINYAVTGWDDINTTSLLFDAFSFLTILCMWVWYKAITFK